MAIDPVKVKEFWDAQARKSKRMRIEGVANLEEDPALLEMKVQAEKAKIMGMVSLNPASRVLDLGAGAGQWSFRFAEQAEDVVAVEYSGEMLELARNERERLGTDNVTLVQMTAQDYVSEKPFDLVFISGLLIYLADEDCEKLAAQCADNTLSGGILILRDGTGILGRYEINNRFSEALNAHYSAIYRTAEDYVSLFERHGFRLRRHEDMFEEGSPLNKWKETRLRVYCFEKP